MFLLRDGTQALRAGGGLEGIKKRGNRMKNGGGEMDFLPVQEKRLMVEDSVVDSSEAKVWQNATGPSRAT